MEENRAVGRTGKGLKTPRRRRVALAVVGFALGTALLIFGLHEALLWAWFGAPEVDVKYVLHIVLAISSIFFVAAVVGWWFVRISPPFLTEAISGEGWEASTRPSDEERAVQYARWFIQMRWIAVLVASTLIAVSCQAFDFLPQAVWWPLLGTVAFLAGLNVFFAPHGAAAGMDWLPAAGTGVCGPGRADRLAAFLGRR